MSAFETYLLFNTIKLHFSTSYDYFKYRGKSTLTLEGFNRKKDKHFYGKLDRMLREEALVDFIVSGLLSNPKLWIGDVFSDEVSKYHSQRMYTLQSMSYVFTSEVGEMFGKVKKPNDMLTTEGDYPILLEWLIGSEVSLEVVCILNGILNFLPMWNKNIRDDIIWPEYNQKILKYTPFINYDKDKYTKILKNIMIGG